MKIQVGRFKGKDDKSEARNNLGQTDIDFDALGIISNGETTSKKPYGMRDEAVQADDSQQYFSSSKTGEVAGEVHYGDYDELDYAQANQSQCKLFDREDRCFDSFN